MEQMFKKYWEKIPYFYSFDFILDPHRRVENYLKALIVMEENMNKREGTPVAICNDATKKCLAFYKRKG